MPSTTDWTPVSKSTTNWSPNQAFEDSLKTFDDETVTFDDAVVLFNGYDAATIRPKQTNWTPA